MGERLRGNDSEQFFNEVFQGAKRNVLSDIIRCITAIVRTKSLNLAFIEPLDLIGTALGSFFEFGVGDGGLDSPHLIFKFYNGKYHERQNYLTLSLTYKY